jgi:D-galactarolactone isomerase
MDTPDATRPRLQAPAGAVDTHMHVYRPDRYPYRPGPAHQPPVASVSAYRAMLLDTLLDWAPDDATRRRILRDNPAELYGF